jgi:hypothetical protein
LIRGDRNEFVELSVGGIVTGLQRQALKNLAIDESALLNYGIDDERNGNRWIDHPSHRSAQAGEPALLMTPSLSEHRLRV